jgi:hypothetical protein
MRFVMLVAVAALSACATPPADVEQAPQAVGSAGLSGDWVVDLSTNPAQPYTQPMSLTLAAGGAATGSFYNSEIEAGRWKTDRGRTCVSFRTSDGVGPYHTAACLDGGQVHGQTWAEHRNFLFNWNAVRPTATQP